MIELLETALKLAEIGNITLQLKCDKDIYNISDGGYLVNKCWVRNIKCINFNSYITFDNLENLIKFLKECNFTEEMILSQCQKFIKKQSIINQINDLTTELFDNLDKCYKKIISGIDGKILFVGGADEFIENSVNSFKLALEQIKEIKNNIKK